MARCIGCAVSVSSSSIFNYTLLTLFLGTDRKNPKRYALGYGSSNAAGHLQSPTHNMTKNGLRNATAIVRDQHAERALSFQFTPEGFRERFLKWTATCHIAFNMCEQPTFQDMMLYTCPNLRGNDTLATSGSTVKVWLLELFISYQIILVALLLKSKSRIHLSFDLWSAPNHYSMLGIVCHFVDTQFKVRTILLGMKRLFGPHSGDNMAQLVITTIQLYRLEARLGFCVMDNAGDNDTALMSIEKFLIDLDVPIIWSGTKHRLRCFGHIVSLVANAFTANKPLNQAKVRRPKNAPKLAKVVWVRPLDAITKLHTITVFIMHTGQRIEEFEAITALSDDKKLHPIKENDTRWFSTYLMLVRALILRKSIDMFCFNHRVSVRKDEKNLGDSIMSSEDWNYCTEVVAFLKPFFLLVKELEGKAGSGKFI
jgi:hypothetical protein